MRQNVFSLKWEGSDFLVIHCRHTTSVKYHECPGRETRPRPRRRARSSYLSGCRIRAATGRRSGRSWCSQQNGPERQTGQRRRSGELWGSVEEETLNEKLQLDQIGGGKVQRYRCSRPSGQSEEEKPDLDIWSDGFTDTSVTPGPLSVVPKVDALRTGHECQEIYIFINHVLYNISSYISTSGCFLMITSMFLNRERCCRGFSQSLL